MKRVVKGWFRALEVTYDKEKRISKERYQKRKEYYDKQNIKAGDENPNFDTFHPHIHAIILVDKDYFKSDNKDYMNTVDWVHMWRTALKADYDPVCDIRKVRCGKGSKAKHKAVSEVAKYTLKDNDFISRDTDQMDRLISVLNNSLKNRRLYAYGGVLKEIAKQVDLEEKSKKDDKEEIRDDLATVIELYRWNFGFANYVKE